MYVRGEYETLYINDLRFKVEKRIRIAPDTSRIVFFFFLFSSSLFFTIYSMFFNYIILLTVLILNSDRGYKVVKDRESVATDPCQVQWCVGAMVQLCNISMVNNILLIHKKKKKKSRGFLESMEPPLRKNPTISRSIFVETSHSIRNLLKVNYKFFFPLPIHRARDDRRR